MSILKISCPENNNRAAESFTLLYVTLSTDQSNCHPSHPGWTTCFLGCVCMFGLVTCRDESVPPKVSNVLGFSKASLSLKNENNAFTSISTDAANAVAADTSSTSVQENWCYVLYSIIWQAGMCDHYWLKCFRLDKQTILNIYFVRF